MNIFRQMFSKKLIIFDSVGFDSITDFFNNVFVSKVLFTAAGIFVGVLTYIDKFIAFNIYSPARGIYILFAVTIFDIMLGISVAVKEDKFDAYRLNRAWIRLVVQIIIVGLLNQSDIVWTLVSDWMVNTLLLAFVLTTLWSAFKNAYKLKWIQPETYLMLYKILSIDEVINVFLKEFFKKNTKKK